MATPDPSAECTCTTDLICEPCYVAKRLSQGLPPTIEDPQIHALAREIRRTAATRRRREPAA